MRRLTLWSVAAALAAGGLLVPARAAISGGGAPWETSPPAQAELISCYAWAQEQSESLQMQQEQIYQLEQQFKQALASALPNLSFNATEKWIDTSGLGGASSPSGTFASISSRPAPVTCSAVMAVSMKPGET